MILFQFTPLREGRHNRVSAGFERLLFQFTPLREGRRTLIVAIGRLEHFNSRPSARGDHSADEYVCWANISIHAPPRGATADGVQCRNWTGTISIHAPPRGATLATFIDSGGHFTFQFTPLREGRRAGRGRSAQVQDFNSRPSARGDGKRYAISANLLFNPYKSAWLNNSATQFVEIILVIFHRIIV